jgi:hypothetical protein
MRSRDLLHDQQRDSPEKGVIGMLHGTTAS